MLKRISENIEYLVKNFNLIPKGSIIKDLYTPKPTKRVKSETPIQVDPKKGIIGVLLMLLIL